MRRAALLIFVGCGQPAAAIDAPIVDAAQPDALVALDPTSGIYQTTCDGSAGIAIDFDHFIDINDEDQDLRVFTRGADAPSVEEHGISASLGMLTTDEADFEDAARIGDRVYAITSHGRTKDGVLAPTRYRFTALDLAPALGLTSGGASSTVLVDLLAAANWDTPDAAAIAAVQASAQLDQANVAALAPEDQGTNIEGLASDPSAATPQRLAIGFRNPQIAGRALLVTLLNPDDVVTGATSHFGEAITLDLGGLGIRGLAWSPIHDAMLILAGPHDTGGPFQLYKWSGAPADPPLVTALIPPPGGSAEAVVIYPNTKDVQILYDMGDAIIGTGDCKAAPVAAQLFRDEIVHVD